MNDRFAMRRMALSIGTTLLTALTALWPDWIEEIFGVSPDAGNGTVEVAIVAALVVLAAVSWTWTYVGWQQRRS